MIDFDHYTGSKGGSGVWQRIISGMPPHTTYVEPFLGSGVILRAKQAAAVTVGVDADDRVVQAWREKFPAVRVVCGDAISWLKAYKWNAGKLVYCDPPYLFSTRSNQSNAYRHEFSESDHRELLRVLVKLPCYVMISGYRSQVYDTMLGAWRRVDIPTIKRNGQRAVECLWCNFPEPVLLHDYRFVGDNRRERHRIKKKCARWRAKILSMPAWERAVIFNALSELASPGLESRTETPDLVSAPATSPEMVSRDPVAASGVNPW